MQPPSQQSPQHQAPRPLHPRPPVFPFRFHGKGMDLAVIVLKNAFLTAVTFGIYNSWGKVNIRKFMWHNTEFSGQRFSYHGTGRELMLGYAKAFIFFVVVQAIAVSLIGKVKGPLAIPVYAALGGGFAFLLAHVTYAAQRYLYSRTSWRGIFLGMNPNSKPFVKTYLTGYVLTLLSLGLYFPIWQNQLYRIRTNASRLGTLQMRYMGSDKDAFHLFLGSLPLILLTLGFYFLWYKAKVSKFRAHHTWIGHAELGAAKGNLQIEGMDLLKLYVGNMLLLAFTFGLAAPWVMAHNLGFFLSRFAFSGDLRIDQIRQAPSQGSAGADGLASMAHVGIGL